MASICSFMATRLSSMVLARSLPSCLRNFCLCLSCARFRTSCASVRTLFGFGAALCVEMTSGGDAEVDIVDAIVSVRDSSMSKLERTQMQRFREPTLFVYALLV